MYLTANGPQDFRLSLMGYSTCFVMPSEGNLDRPRKHAEAAVHNLEADLQPLAGHVTWGPGLCCCSNALPVPARCEAVHSMHLHHITSEPLIGNRGGFHVLSHVSSLVF